MVSILKVISNFSFLLVVVLEARLFKIVLFDVFFFLNTVLCCG